MQATEPEVGRLERGRTNIVEGVRKGYEHAHLLLRRTAPEHATAGMDGRQAALQVRKISQMYVACRTQVGAVEKGSPSVEVMAVRGERVRTTDT